MRSAAQIALALFLAFPLAAQIRVVRDVAYGPARQQRLDVHAPPNASHAPVLVMVHGGGWRAGDKDSAGVVAEKVAYWVPKGYVFVSVDYRLLPEAGPAEQAADVAAALAFVRQNAARWGGDPARIVAIGHSAGAHLVALVTARDPKSVAGVIVLDSAALDLVDIMNARHLPLYDDAFGDDPDQWRALSPSHALQKNGPPLLVVCSARRTISCRQAKQFVGKAYALGWKASVREEDLTHAEINRELGQPGPYTAAVASFITRAVGGKP